MCGIASIFAYSPVAPPIDQGELLRIREHMIARGPDGAGMWISLDQKTGLAHRRLAIIDLSESGAQPMATESGRLRISFNGEIYNHHELRRELEGKGYLFHSTSDTEVLLHLYADRGQDMVHALRGMYAFAIWDEANKGLFLARDPFGIKPLYIADNGHTIRIASQVKALLRGGAVDTTPEPAGHVGFFLWGHVPEPYTLYKGIRALGAGNSLWVDASGRKQEKQFFNVTDEMAKAVATRIEITREGMQERLHAALLDSVRHHMIADVPVGIFLSSGLDSTTLTALAMEALSPLSPHVREGWGEGGGNLRTVTLGFREFQGTHDDEVPLAEVVARHYGTQHLTRWVTKDDFHQARHHLLEAMDQPSTDAVNSYFVSKAAADSGLKVALSGLGGDELFGGYPSFYQIPALVRALQPMQSLSWLGKGFRRFSAPILKQFTSPKYAGLLEYGGTYGSAYLLRRGMYMPWELPDVLDGEMVRDGWRELQTNSRLQQTTRGIEDAHLKVAALETTWYMRNQLLRDTDWASMAHSLEVRMPLVDIELFRAAVPLFNSPVPPDKRAMAATPRNALPDKVLSRKKTGFVIPVREWLLGGEQLRLHERGLKGWAKFLHAFNGGRRSKILALITDAFGGHGGIALYNRDFLNALCAHPRVANVVAFPRHVVNPLEKMPENLSYVTASVGGKFRYLSAVLRHALQRPRIDLIVCGHVNLLPLAYVLRFLLGAPVLLEIYGIDAWQKTRSRLVNYLASGQVAVSSISEITRKRFLAWTGRTAERTFLLPNAIHAERYGPGLKPPALLARYHLQDKVILMTMGRLVSEDRCKGFDEILELLPTLAQTIPDVAYLIVGTGADIDRLKDKARTLGIADRVVFTGMIAEQEKADHYRLADVYVMPSHGEGFGFVLLEAMACGVPVIASKLDGGREAVRDGELGLLVDPTKPAEIVGAINTALTLQKTIPPGLAYFSFENFQQRAHQVVDAILADTPSMARQQ